MMPQQQPTRTNAITDKFIFNFLSSTRKSCNKGNGGIEHFSSRSHLAFDRCTQPYLPSSARAPLVFAHGEINILCTQLRSVNAVQDYICSKRQHSLITPTKPRNENSMERSNHGHRALPTRVITRKSAPCDSASDCSTMGSAATAAADALCLTSPSASTGNKNARGWG